MKTLVLAPSYAPTEPVPVERAIVLLLEGKAQSLMDHPERVFRNATGRVRVPAPLVIVLRALADSAKVIYGEATWTRANVYARDDWTCQYCGRHERDLVRSPRAREVEVRYGSETVGLRVASEFLTVDHVTPLSRGGRNEFSNTVAACSSCNNRKDDRTPAEARMYLRRKPRSMTRADAFLARLDDEARALVAELFDSPVVETDKALAS